MASIGWKRTRLWLKQLFHYSDGHGAVGLLAATGQKHNKLLRFQKAYFYHCVPSVRYFQRLPA